MTLMWVKEHSRVAGNEAAGHMAGRAGWIDRRIARPEIATLAGIRQAFPIHSKPKHPSWDPRAYTIRASLT